MARRTPASRSETAYARWSRGSKASSPTRGRPAAREVAFWRYEQIEEALDEALDRFARAQMLRRISQTPVRWPSGDTRRISVATLYRWLDAFRKTEGLTGLMPRRRKDHGRHRRLLPGAVVEEALRLLSDDPGLTFTLLVAALEAKFSGAPIPRSTLQRRLAAHPSYQRFLRARRHSRRRTRFVAQAPHDIWQTDALGPVTLRLTTREVIEFHILTILDDATRAVLAAIVVLSPDLAAAVRVFRMAALRWGLPRRLYADRASIFDSKAFRMGLASLGSHRIATKARNPEARGKIEAYHRVLRLWFVGRLPAQQVQDLLHLQQLLDAVIESLYQTHRHRGIRTTPKDALDGRVSGRSVPPTRLYEAFREERRLKAHPKTGEVDIGEATYLVPDELRGRRLIFLLDPAGELPPLVVAPESGNPLALRRAAVKPGDVADSAEAEPSLRWGHGVLQAIHDHWHATARPLAEPGFGLPEIYALLARACGRHVPLSDAEAALVHRFYRDLGPWSRAAAEAAFDTVASQLGPGRPMKTYLDALRRRVESDGENPKARRTR